MTRASANVVRPSPKVFPVAGFMLGVVVDGRHDRFGQLVTFSADQHAAYEDAEPSKALPKFKMDRFLGGTRAASA